MAESINKYGGFYIGRYETTIDETGRIGSKYNTEVLRQSMILKDGTNNDNEPYYYKWWGLYHSQRNLNIIGNSYYFQTNMIWGQQWDKMIDFFDDSSIDYTYVPKDSYNLPSSISYSGQAIYTNKENNGNDINDKIYNIYDLRGNVLDLTAETTTSYYVDRRVGRGETYSTYGSADSRIPEELVSTSKKEGSRMTLYIK